MLIMEPTDARALRPCYNCGHPQHADACTATTPPGTRCACRQSQTFGALTQSSSGK